MSVARIFKEAKVLSLHDRKELVKLLVDTFEVEQAPRKHRLSELRGLGKEIWEGIDTQEYLNQLRDEWDNRSS